MAYIRSKAPGSLPLFGQPCSQYIQQISAVCISLKDRLFISVGSNNRTRLGQLPRQISGSFTLRRFLNSSISLTWLRRNGYFLMIPLNCKQVVDLRLWGIRESLLKKRHSYIYLSVGESHFWVACATSCLIQLQCLRCPDIVAFPCTRLVLKGPRYIHLPSLNVRSDKDTIFQRHLKTASLVGEVVGSWAGTGNNGGSHLFLVMAKNFYI